MPESLVLPYAKILFLVSLLFVALRVINPYSLLNFLIKPGARWYACLFVFVCVSLPPSY